MRTKNFVRLIGGLVLWCGVAAAQNDGSGMRLQLLSGKTGRPVANQKVMLERPDGMGLDGKKGGTAAVTDGEGYAAIPGSDATLLAIAVELHKPCSKTLKHTFDLGKVRAAGVVSENACKPRITLYPQPGTLVFFVRDMTWLEKMRK